jgi:hypothetical protein
MRGSIRVESVAGKGRHDFLGAIERARVHASDNSPVVSDEGLSAEEL